MGVQLLGRAVRRAVRRKLRLEVERRFMIFSFGVDLDPSGQWGIKDQVA